MKSLLSNDRECYVCGSTRDLHKHHIIYGPNRKKSEQYGLWVYLCARHHNMSDAGVHFNRALDLQLKEEAQLRWQQENGTKEDFIRAFGRSYL